MGTVKIKPRTSGLKRSHVAALMVLIVILFYATTSQQGRLESSATTTAVPKKKPARLDPAIVRQKLLAMGQTPLSSKSGGDPWKAQLFAQLDHIRVSCGTLCQLNTVAAVKQHSIPVPGSPLPMVVAPDVNCLAIMGDEGIDAGDPTAPAIPDELEAYFTLGDAYEVIPHERMKDIYVGKTASQTNWKTGNVWEQADIDDAVRQVGRGEFPGTYGPEATNYVRDTLAGVAIKDKRILVVGSENPWVEVICLHHGAAQVVTLEYGELVSHHPKLKTLVPQKFRELFFSGELGEFDGVVTHSSLEHSGLGRYGDALNPWGDILAVARTWCVTKDGGFLYLGIPTGMDFVVSNWHRVYGILRWPLVTANWRSLDRSNGSELSRAEVDAHGNGGHGYLFEKVSKSELLSIAKVT